MKTFKNIFFFLCFFAFITDGFAQSKNDGKWIVSDSSLNYQFDGSRFPSKMANYKDSSIIVAGLETQSPVDSHRVFINRSTDQGKSWHRIYQELTGSAQFGFYQVQHPSLSRIIAISTKFVKDSLGVDRKAYFLMNSNDTGTSWAVNDTIFGIYDNPVTFNFNGKYGIITVATPDSSILLYSENYGDSWKKYPLPADLQYGVGKVLIKGTILLTENYPSKKMGYTNDITKGSWQLKNLPDTFNSYATYIRNKDTIWSATKKQQKVGSNFQRNIIVSTTNGGQSWQKPLDVFEKDSTWQKTGLNKIDFATKYYGVAVGNSVSYFTEDGGKTWENKGFYNRPLVLAPQTIFYYYNPLTQKRLLMCLLNNNYIMKYKFKETTSLTELKDIKSQLKVFPNPVRDVLFMKLPPELKIKNIELKILSIGGKLVKDIKPHNINNNEYKISIKNLRSGAYILQLKSKNYRGNRKFIVE